MKKIFTLILVVFLTRIGLGQYSSYSVIHSVGPYNLETVSDNGYYFSNADWDNDGDLDAMFGPSYLMGGYKLYMLENLGNNEFAEEFTTIYTPSAADTYTQYHFGNLDGDGVIDLIVVEANLTDQQDLTNVVSCYTRGASNQLVLASSLTGLPANYGIDPTYDLKVRDLNGDGLDDIVFFGGTPAETDQGPETQAHLYVYFNQGNGVMQESQHISYVIDEFYATEAAGIVFADVNNDGLIDIQVYSYYVNVSIPNTVQHFIADASNQYVPTPEVDTQVFLPMNFNGDNLDDLYLFKDQNLDFYMQNATIRINDGAGGYLPAVEIPLSAPVYGTTNFQTAASTKFIEDINSDGFDDLFLEGNIHLNNGGITFNTPLVLDDAGNATESPIIIQPSPFGDFNQDGYLDLIGAQYSFASDIIQYYYFQNCQLGCPDPVPGCTDSGACNYNESATIDDGNCDYSCVGCTDPLALNFAADATIDNGTCIYSNGNNFCYNATTITCGQVLIGSTALIPSDASTLSGISCGSYGTGGQSWFSFTSPFTGEVTFSTIDAVNTDFDTKLHVFSGSCESLVCEGSNDDFLGMQSQITIDAVAGEIYWIRLGGYLALEGSYGFSVTCEGAGCTDVLACNYSSQAISDDGSCEYCSCNPECGCTDSEACNYDPSATIDDGSCYTEFIVVAPESTVICPGTLTSASYFIPMIADANVQWTSNTGSTIYNLNSLMFYAEIMETSEFTLTVSDNNGCTGSDSFIVTVADCVYGCMDTEACNFNPLANNTDNSCDYSCLGCTDPEALNYSEDATLDNGSCYYEGEGNTCINPIVLSCGLGVYENMIVGVANDNATSGAMACGGNSVGGQRWYTYTAAINSEITVSTINAGTNFDTYLKVYTGTCGDLECVAQNDDVIGSGFQSQIVFNAVAGETYLVRVGGFVMQQGSFVLTFECGGGCLDEAACNYEPGAPFDDGSCTYGADCYGCTDQNAANFSPIAVYNQGCQYQPSIFVYHDMDGNGIHNSTEPGLANWPVYIPGMSATIYTNASGYIDVNLPSSSFQLNLINNTDNWISSTLDQVMIDVPEAMSAEFGLIPSTGETFFVAGPYDGFWDIIHCNNGYETGVLISNTGSTPLTGTLTMTCDEQFTPEADEYGTVAPDQVAPGFAQWNISGYTAGSNQLFSMHIDGPGVANLGTTYPFQFNLILVDGNGNEIYNNSWTTTPFIACAYDPNDITATPVGLYEPHYIMPGERLQYRIRFQNTGNYYAEDITIMDQLDPAVFDMTSFTPMYASADMVACLHDDGLVDFIFNDIYLPDSTTDEEGSHGFVVYMIDARADLAPNTVLYNQAAIFFEQNPAIITNQVFHTIFDCDSFTGITGDTEVCEGEIITLSAEQPYVETYSWMVNGETHTGSAIELSGLVSGTHEIILNTSNPLCDANHMTELTISNLPMIEAGEDITICAGNTFILNATSDAEIIWSNGLANGSEYSPVATEVLTATATNAAGCSYTDDMTIQVSNLPSDDLVVNGNILSAPDGASWQWYYNGNLLEGEIAQNLTTNGGGVYYVITTNQDGCSTTSQEVMVVGIENASLQQVLVYPNPMTESARIVLPSGLNKVTITDALGKVVLSKDNCFGTMILNRPEFASGVYHLQVEQNNNSYTTRLIVN